MSLQRPEKPAMNGGSITSLTGLCRKHLGSLWGQRHWVTPRLVDWIHGDGLQVIYLEPMDTRPDYYVARIDSNVNMDNCGKPPVFCDEVLEDLLDAIEDQYGRAHDKYEHDNGRMYCKWNPFPALGWGGGSWGRLAMLKESDKRSEHEIRTALARARKTKQKLCHHHSTK